MRVINIIHIDKNVLAKLVQQPENKKRYTYESGKFEKILNVDVKKTNKGIYMTFILAPYNKNIRQFISNLNLQFEE